MSSIMQRLVAAFFVITLVTTLVSCGGSGGSDDSSQVQGKGTVGILLTDKPADPALFAAIIASITRVELMGSDENGPVTLYSGPAKEFDLLRLRNESIPLAFKDNVPAGNYCKIRLILDKLELVLADPADLTPDDFTDNEVEHPKLPGNGKLDLVARDCFNVLAGEVLALQLDIDAGKSIHIIENPSCTNNENKSCFNFRPVMFVDVIDKDFDSKLARLSGEIRETYPDTDSLLLCGALPSQYMDNEGCVKVHFGKDSAFFVSDGNVGEPKAISELLDGDPTNVGKEITVVGWVKPWNNTDYDDDKSDAYYPLLYLEALVAELGDFRQVEGKVETVNEDNTTGFSMALSSGSSIEVDYQPLLYPDEPGINGTRIVSKSGMLLEPGEIEIFEPVQVDGTPNDSTSPVISAALVIVDKSALDTEQVTGVIQSLGIDTLELLDTGPVCSASTDPLMVDLIKPLEILTVIITDDGGSEILPGGILRDGQTVGMNGSCVFFGGYQTDNVVIIDDRRTN